MFRRRKKGRAASYAGSTIDNQKDNLSRKPKKQSKTDSSSSKPRLTPLQNLHVLRTSGSKPEFETISTNFDANPNIQQILATAGTTLTPLKRRNRLDDLLHDTFFSGSQTAKSFGPDIGKKRYQSKLNDSIREEETPFETSSDTSKRSESRLSFQSNASTVAYGRNDTPNSTVSSPSVDISHFTLGIRKENPVFHMRTDSADTVISMTEDKICEMAQEINRLQACLSFFQSNFHANVDNLHNELQKNMVDKIVSITKTRVPQIYFAVLPKRVRTNESIVSNIAGKRWMASSQSSLTVQEQSRDHDPNSVLSNHRLNIAGRTSMENIPKARGTELEEEVNINGAAINSRFSQIMEREITTAIKETVDKSMLDFRRALLQQLNTFCQQVNRFKQCNKDLEKIMLEVRILCHQHIVKLSDMEREYSKKKSECEMMQFDAHEKEMRIDIMRDQLTCRNELLDEMRLSFHKELNQVKMAQYETNKQLGAGHNPGTNVSSIPATQERSSRPRASTFLHDDSRPTPLDEYPIGNFTLNFVHSEHFGGRDMMKEAALQMERKMNAHIKSISHHFSEEKRRMQQEHVVEMESKNLEIDNLKRRLAVAEANSNHGSSGG